MPPNDHTPAWRKNLKDRLRKILGFQTARLVYHVARGGERGRAASLLLRPPNNMFQPYPTTQSDRYPVIFRQVRAMIGDGADRRLLSFGCSTGEEMFSLRQLFPQAAIAGIDINPRNISIGRAKSQKLGLDRLEFITAGSTENQPSESCDAIFAMAVFRHGDLNVNPPPARCDSWIRFGDFEKTTSDLARCLKPGGVLVIKHAQFRFADTAASAGFDVAFHQSDDQTGPCYGRDNRLLSGASYDEVMFRKTGGSR
jgi:SAM-dependent methyltransferase